MYLVCLTSEILVVTMSSIKTKSYKHISDSGEVQISLKKPSRKKQYTLPKEYANLGFYLAVPLIASIFIGRVLDARFGTDALYTILGVLFGTIITFYHLIKLYTHDGSAH